MSSHYCCKTCGTYLYECDCNASQPGPKPKLETAEQVNSVDFSAETMRKLAEENSVGQIPALLEHVEREIRAAAKSGRRSLRVGMDRHQTKERDVVRRYLVSKGFGANDSLKIEPFFGLYVSW